MFRKLSTKLSLKSDRPKSSPKKAAPLPSAQGAAVPYNDRETHPTAHNDIADTSQKDKGKSPSKNGSTTQALVPDSDGYLFGEAAARGDVEGIRQLMKGGGVLNAWDETGNTPLHRASDAGQQRAVRYLLLHGAYIDARNNKGRTALYLATQNGHTGTVGVLLDYMHSVDNTTRDPFIMIRAKKSGKKEAFVMLEEGNCAQMKPFKKRGCDVVHIMIAHAQRAEDMAIFLYSVLDVSVENSFIQNIIGPMNMKNFQRFESKAKSNSITVLKSNIRTMEAIGYTNLRSLILVSCGITKLALDGLHSLELLDIRYNKIDHLPSSIKNCRNLKTLRCSHNHIRRFPHEIGQLSQNLVSLDCSYNHIKRLTSHIVKCSGLRHLQCDHNGIIEIPLEIGLLNQMEELYVHNNKLSQLPLSVSGMTNLQRISFHHNPLLNIPVDFPERAHDVKQYLKCLQDDPVPNRTVKLVLVGQEGVGKTTLLKALKRTMWAIPRTPTTPKTDGIDVKDIQMDDLLLRCFDCGGDVDFNETHNFFITQGALYLACFNLAEYCLSTVEKSSFLLGRLQLWLQYIFSKVPNALVLIVGTHADHESLDKKLFQEIWEQLRTLLVSAREHHQNYFRGRDKVRDCLLCQNDSRCLRRTAGAGTAGFVNLGFDDASSTDDETSFAEGSASVVSFPHIVGYYEVSSIKAIGNTGFQMNANKSIEHLKEAVKDVSHRLIEKNPEIPRKWSNVQESLANHIEMNPENCIATLEEFSKIARAHNIVDVEMQNMLHFFKAQGSVLYFPQLNNLEDLVILDPEWLAKIFSSVVSYRDTGIDEGGFIDRDKLKSVWSDVDENMRDKILTLLRHFGLCLPVSDSNMELFPCKLPLGEPDDVVWPTSPGHSDRQLTFTITFPSLIPPPLFSELTVIVYRQHDTESTSSSRYFSNHIVDTLRLDKMGCKVCGKESDSDYEVPNDPMMLHKVHFELIPHRRNILITARGCFPCCITRKISRILRKVISKYEGLGMGTIELDTLICPGCYMQRNPFPHKFNVNKIFSEPKSSKRIICSNAHLLPNAKSLMMGVVADTCLPNATIRPKSTRDMHDYSGCPNLFIILPVNKDGISFDNENRLFASSLMMDGFAAHLLCEFPDGYHLTRAPGYRLKHPKEFMDVYGTHVINVLHLLKHVSGSTVSAQYSKHTTAVSQKVSDIIKELKSRFPPPKSTPNTGDGYIIEQIQERGKTIKREDLRRHLHVVDKPGLFGPLRRLKYGDQYLWLCTEHFRQLRMLTIEADLRNEDAVIESAA